MIRSSDAAAADALGNVFDRIKQQQEIGWKLGFEKIYAQIMTIHVKTNLNIVKKKAPTHRIFNDVSGILELVTGIEPATCWLQISCTANCAILAGTHLV